jgi:hypothetical protein
MTNSLAAVYCSCVSNALIVTYIASGLPQASLLLATDGSTK